MNPVSQLPRWQRPIAYLVIVLAAPFVCIWQGWTALKWRVWSGRIYLKQRHGRS